MQEEKHTLHASLSIQLEEIPTPRQPLRRGDLCPQCGQARLDYNGMLDLECPHCGYTQNGGGGCT